MKFRLALLGAMLMIVAACGSPYFAQPSTYHSYDPGYVKATVVNIQMRKVSAHDGVSSSCVMGITASGIGVVGTVASAPMGLVAWAVFGGASATGAVLSVADCWNDYNATKDVFDVFTQCPHNSHAPVLQTTFDDYNKITAFVNMDNCYCSFFCQAGLDDPNSTDPREMLWASIPMNGAASVESRNYWHAGANHVNGPVMEDPPPLDPVALATEMGLPYAGCDDVGAIGPEQMSSIC